MIKVGTRVVVSDNSGAKEAGCINILGHSNRKTASVGDMIVISVKSVRARTSSSSNSKKDSSGSGKSASGGKKGSNSANTVNKGSVHRAIVVRTKKVNFSGAIKVSFDDNAIILLNKKGEPLATRLFGPVLGYQLRKKKALKVLSMAPIII
jgi:large subunit ribosomal protein L14